MSSKLSEAEIEAMKVKLQEEGTVRCPSEGCLENFKSIWGLRFHLKKNSCNAPKFTCKSCEKVFLTRVSLHQHCESCISEVDKRNKSLESVNVEKVEGNKPFGLLKRSLKEVVASDSNKTLKAKTLESAVKHSTSTSISELQKDKSSPESHSLAATQEQLSQTCNKTQKILSPKTHVDNDDVVFIPDSIATDEKFKSSSELQKVETSANQSHKQLLPTQKPCTDSIKDSNSMGLVLETPKRKRGRPKKLVSQPRNESKQVDSNSVIAGESLPDGQQAISSKKRPGRKKSQYKTPENRIVATSSRRSSRSTIRKVNYAQIDASDDEDSSWHDDDSDDDDKMVTPNKENPDGVCDTTTTPSPKSTPGPNKEGMQKRKRGRPRKGEERPKSAAREKTEKSGQPKKSKAEDTKYGTDNTNNNTNVTEEKTEDHSLNAKDKTGNSSTPDKPFNVDDKESEVHQDNEEVAAEENREIGSESEEVKPTPNKRRKGVVVEDNRLAALRQKVKRGGKIPCDNKCGRKFTSFAGYLAHMKMCGKARQVFKCEICNKEYQSEPGLKYHMKAVHEEKPAIIIKEKPIENKTPHTDALYSESGRKIRNAAARAMEKVQDLKNTKVEACGTVPSIKMSHIVDAHIIKLRQGLVTNAMKAKWKEEINNNGKKICLNEGCNEEFTSIHVLETHVLQCGFDEAPYQCKECQRGFLTLIGARYHVGNTHLKPGDEESKNSEDDHDYSVKSDSSDEDDAGVMEISDDESELLELSREKGTKKILSLAVGGNSKAYREHLIWKRKIISDEQVFTELFPMIAHWSRVEIHDIPEYIPVATSSPCFSIARPDDKTLDHLKENRLPLFTSVDKNCSDIYGDRTFFAGGPIWGLSWCPNSDTKAEVDQYIVVSTHRSYETVNKAYKSHTGKGTLQLWTLGKLASKSSRSGDSPKLSLCIAHEYGPVYKMVWCPYQAWQHPEIHVDDNCVPRLGLLAVACGDGIVRILSIPHPDKLLPKLPDQILNSSKDKEYNQVMVHGTSLIDLVPCPLNIKYQGQRGMALCVDWSHFKPFHHIAAGFSDGSVGIWNLASKSILLTRKLENKHQTLRMAPFIFINAHSSLVRDLALCPSSQDFMVTGGEERCYKIWNLKCPHTPSVLVKKGFPYEIEWPLHINGFFSCEQELYFKEQPSVKYCNFTTIDHVRPVCSHLSSVWSLSFNQWLNILASSDVAGDVYLSKLPTKNTKCIWPLYKVDLKSIKSSEDNQKENPDKLKQIHPSLEETIQRSRIVFRDVNPLQFHNEVSLDKKELKETPSVYDYNRTTLQSINKVQWNPNKQAMTWIATGGASGLVRLHNIKEAKSAAPPPD